jgi:hypothetical protein
MLRAGNEHVAARLRRAPPIRAVLRLRRAALVRDVPRRALLAPMLCAAAVFGSAAVARAAPTVDTEPNDYLFEMNGPVSRDGVVGTLGSSTDVDEYLLQVQPARMVKLVFTLVNAGAPQCPLAPLGGVVHYAITTEGAEPVFSGAFAVGTEFVEEKDLTTPGNDGDPVQPLRLTFSAEGQGAAGCQYRFTATDSGGHPTDAIDETPLPDIPTVTVPEPNDLPAQAFGPLQGDTYYVGTIDSPTDVDMLSTWLFPGQPVTFELSAAGAEVHATVVDPAKNILLPDFPVKPEQVLRAPIVGSPALNLISVRGQLGAKWRLRLTPADAVLAAAPGGRPARPPSKKYKTGATVHRVAGARVRYAGKITSEAAGCKPGRLVILRHAGTGVKRFSITRTNADGSFTVSRQTRTGGTVYVAVAESSTAARLCRFGRSKRVGA